MRKGVFITATDTGVGKTAVSSLLYLALKKRGVDCAVMKPVESGAIKKNGRLIWPDTEFLRKISGARESISLISPFRFKKPLAPYVAAKLEGRNIEVEKIKRAFDDLINRHDCIIVEGAGGLLVPLKDNYLVADLIKELDIPLIIVSRLGLGTINHTLLTIDSARERGIEVLGVVFNQNQRNKAGLSEKTNPQIISRISGIPVLGSIPYLSNVDLENGKYSGLKKAIKYLHLQPLLQEEQKETLRLRQWDKKYVWHPFTQMKYWLKDEPLVIEEGKGSYIKDTNGKWYLDGVSSLWVNLHGHRKTALDEALKQQINRISHSTLLGLSNVPSAELARRLISIAPQGLAKVFYSDSGSTAVEIALKIAFQYWQQKSPLTKSKTKFVRFVNAYHGDTIGAVSVGGIDLFHQLYQPLLFKSLKVNSPYCYRCQRELSYPECEIRCLEDTEKILKKHHRKISALIIEPLVYAAAGILTQPKGFLKGIEKLCRKYKVLLICDEVATGFGRTGKMFACEKEKVSPDIICLAKGITAGYMPLAATLTSEKIFNAFLGEYKDKKTFFHGHTYTGNPLACSVALANLKIFEKEKVLKNLVPKIASLKNKLKRFSALSHVGDVRQCGFMVGIELVRKKETKAPYRWEEKVGIKVCQEARKYGVILRSLGNVIVLMPPLSITEKEMDQLLSATCQAIKAVTES